MSISSQKQYNEYLDQLPAELRHIEPRNWKSDDIERLINSMGDSFKPIAELFVTWGVNGLTLLLLEETDLDDTGIKRLALKRLKIMFSIVRFIQSYQDITTQNVSSSTLMSSLNITQLQRQLEEEKQKQHDSTLCTLCWERSKCVAFRPCGHVCSCETCSRKVSQCPLCRAPIQQRVRVFL